MGFITKKRSQYKVTGKDIHAFTDYIKPSGKNKHSRGQSVGPFLFSLEGKIITITELVYRTEEGTTTKNNVYLPFEIVKATVEDHEGDFFAWVVYEGVEKVEFYTPPNAPPSSNNPDATQVKIPAGRTLELDLHSKGEIKPPADYPNKKVVIKLIDDKGEIVPIDKKVVFIDTAGNETSVPVTSGIGGTDDLAAGSYNAIIDNETGPFTPFANALTNLDITNPKYLRPGWVYQIVTGLGDKLPSVLNGNLYKHKWVQGDAANGEFFYGVHPDTSLAALPPLSTPAMFEGKFKEGEFLRIKKVLFSAAQVSNTGRGAPFLAAVVKKSGLSKPECFSWLIYDDGANNTSNPKAEIVKTLVTIGANKTIIKVKVIDVGLSHAAGSIETVEPSLVSGLKWHFPAAGEETKDNRSVWYKHADSSVEELLGVTLKAKNAPSVLFSLNEDIGSETLPVKIKLWQTHIATDPANPGTDKETVKEVQVEIKSAHRTADTTKFEYAVPLGENDFFDNVSKLIEEIDPLTDTNPRLHHRKIGLTADAATSATGAEIVSNTFAYPVAQRVLFYLPGLYGSRLAVNYRGSVEESWPNLDENFELLACDDSGRAIYEPEKDGANLTMVKQPAFISRSIHEADTKTAELKADTNEFPEIFLDAAATGDKLEHVIYKEMPYDWRFPLNEYLVEDQSDGLSDGEKKFPFIADLARRLKTEFRAITKDLLFAAEKITLIGFDAGGVLAQGLLSFENPVKNLVDEVFYINVPFWGAPAMEYIMMTGSEPDVAMFTKNERVRQTAANTPAYYFLSPNERYADASGVGWSVGDAKARLHSAALHGVYKIVPADLKGWPTDIKRGSLQYNERLGNLAKEYDTLVKENYPNIPSYIFHSAGRDTLSNTNTPQGRDSFIRIYEFPTVESEQIQEELNNRLLATPLTSKFLFGGSPQVGVFVDDKDISWYIHDPNFFCNRYFYLEELRDKLNFFAVDTSLKPAAAKLNHGNGTVPSLSQLGLWYDHGADKNVYVTNPMADNPIHLDGPNQAATWRQVFKAIRKEPLEIMTPPELSALKSGPLPDVTPVDPAQYADIGTAPAATGNIVLNVNDETSNPAPKGTTVTIQDNSGSSEAIFTVIEAGKLTFPDVLEDDYRIIQVDVNAQPHLGAPALTTTDDDVFYSLQVDASAGAPLAAEAYYPDMVIDYQMGRPVNRVGLSNECDPRFILHDEPTPNLGDHKRWSLGQKGWVLLGFTDGFYVSDDFELLLREIGDTGEYIDIWIAREDAAINTIRYIANTANQYEVMVQGGLVRNYNIPFRASAPGEILFSPVWLDNSNQHWHYVGYGQGNQGDGGQDVVPMAHMPPGRYYYILIHDLFNYTGTANPSWNGADMVHIGVRSANPDGTSYHLLVIDDSASAFNVKESYHQEVEAYIKNLYLMGGTRYLGIRLIRWKSDQVRTLSKAGQNLDEKTRRVTINNQLWIDISTIIKEDLIEKVKSIVKIKQQYTPLAETIDDIIAKDIPAANDLDIYFITDGIPDSFGAYPSPRDLTEAQRNKILAQVQNNGVIVQKFLELHNLGQINPPLIVGEFNLQGDASTIKFGKDIRAAYAAMVDANGNPVIAGVGNVMNRPPIDHATIAHTDCLRNNPGNLVSTDLRNRINPGCRKRWLSYDGTHPNEDGTQLGQRIELPHSWTGGVQTQESNDYNDDAIDRLTPARI